ncbi:MAG: Dabb family protein [Planctomycetota bacterium]|jgi:hypothetical protein
MKKLPVLTIVATLVAAVLPLVAPNDSPCVAAEAGERMLAHDVYFTLKDDSLEAKKKLVAGCKKYLSDHPGTVWFAAGMLVEEHLRDVNDRDFDVALHIVFKDKASHDKYQEADGHHRFIEDLQDNWEAVRVFDSWLDAASHGMLPVDVARSAEAKTPRIPHPASRFAGMIRGKVVAKIDGKVVVAVEEVTRVWKTSKAKSPQTLVGSKVLVEGPTVEGRPEETAARFLQSLKPGETVTVDVAHRSGQALTILELTEDQRARIAEK